MDKSRTMIGVVLPGNGTVESNEFAITITAAGPGPIPLGIPTINLEKASEAYRVAAEGRSGKVAIVFDRALSSWKSSPEVDHA